MSNNRAWFCGFCFGLGIGIWVGYLCVCPKQVEESVEEQVEGSTEDLEEKPRTLYRSKIVSCHHHRTITVADLIPRDPDIYLAGMTTRIKRDLGGAITQFEIGSPEDSDLFGVQTLLKSGDYSSQQYTYGSWAVPYDGSPDIVLTFDGVCLYGRIKVTAFFLTGLGE